MVFSNRRVFQGLAISLTQHRVALALKISVITGAVIAFYFQDLTMVFRNALSDQTSYHILAIPFLFAYMLYRKRAMVRATFSEPTRQGSFVQQNFSLLCGVLLCTAAIFVYWFGSNTFTPMEYHMATLPFFTAGLVLVFFSGQTLRQVWFPIAFLAFLTPPPIETLYSAGSWLSDLSAHAANALANFLGIDSTILVQFGNPLIVLTRPDLSVMNLSVDVACSGVYSLIGFALFAVFMAYITRGKLWKKVAVLGLGVPLLICLNIIRLTIIVAMGYYQGAGPALEMFHTAGASSLTFIGSLILFGVTEKVNKKTSTEPCPVCSSGSRFGTEEFCSACGRLLKFPKRRLGSPDLVKILGVILVVGTLLTIQVPVFALTEGPAEVLNYTPMGSQPSANALPLPQIEGYNLTYVFRDTAFEKMSGQEVSSAYAYGSADRSKPTVWVSVEIAATQGPLHRWETCLVNWPLSHGQEPKATQLDSKDIETQTNPPKVARYFAFQRHSNNQTQAVLYWYETASFHVNGSVQQKNVKISLSMYPKTSSELSETEDLLMPFAAAINNHWQSIKTWTPVALALSENGLALSGVALGVLVVLLIYKGLLDYQEKKASLIVYNKVSSDIQCLTQATLKAQAQKKSTVQKIAEELRSFTRASVSLTGLRRELEGIENVGLVKRKIVNYDDEPAVQWKNQLPRRHRWLGSVRSLFFSSSSG